jgi:cytoskeleton protein RodZ
MIEAAGQAPASSFDPAPAQDGPSAGALLREAREAAGIDVASLAVALKVPVRKLEALEADRFDQLPDAVFVRALAASICRNLKIDPAPVLQRLPATGGPRLAPHEGGINAPFRSPSDGAGPTWLDHLSRPVFLAVFALLLGALVLILLPSRRDDATPTPAATPAPAEVAFQAAPSDAAPSGAAPSVVLAGTSLSAPIAARSQVPAATVTSSVSPTVMATATASAAKTAMAPPQVAAPQGAATTSATAPAPSGIVVFKAKAPSWIEVTDARGAVPLRRLLAAGESAAASGALPLAVTVGSASATEVEVRGKPFNLAPLARDNVARFEVK